MGSISVVSVFIRLAVPPFYGVVVVFPADCRYDNGFVRSFGLPCGDEGFGFRFGLRLPEDCEEKCGDY